MGGTAVTFAHSFGGCNSVLWCALSKTMPCYVVTSSVSNFQDVPDTLPTSSSSNVQDVPDTL